MSDAKAVSTMLARTHSREQALADRLHCQLRFAEQLCELRPEACAAWKPLLEQAHRLVAARTVDGAHLPGLVGEIETLLAPFAPLAKSFTVHGIGHAHIDMNWMWGWPETVAVVVDTVGTVLRLLDEFPEFHFTQSQAEIYRILAEHAPPGYLDAIRRHIASGRWEVAASHWVEGDKNMASGESLCRQVLYAKRYLHQLLGVAPETLTIDWAPDTFGHAATMPTYLAQAGIRHTFLHRPGAHTAEAWPEAFRWYAPDGAMTLVLNGMRGGYNGIFCPRMLLDRLGTWWRTTGLSAAPYLYGVGDHGGGPTRRDLLQCREVSSWPIFPRITLGPAGGFFAELERVQDRLPAVRGELNFAFTGCYTSQSLLKRCNRLGEARLDDAERAAAAASIALGTAYPAERLAGAWRNVLFSQFHDILPGSCLHDGRTFSHGLFQQSAATAGQTCTQSLRALAASIRTDSHRANSIADPSHSGFSGGAGFASGLGGPSLADGSHSGDDRAYVAFNFGQLPRSEVVEAVIWENTRDYGNVPFHRQAFNAIAADGSSVPTQVLEKGTSWGHDFIRLAFPATVPALGWAHYALHATATPASVPTGAWQFGRDDWPAHYSFHDLPSEGLENSLVRCELDPRSGGIRRLTCKRSGLDLINQSGPAIICEAGCERAHGMSAWAIDHTMQTAAITCLGLRRVSNGPHVAAIEVRLAVMASEIVLTYELRRDDPRLHMTMRIMWREIGDAQRGVPFLRLAVPTQLSGARLTGEIPFGAITRSFTAGEVVPAQRWAMVSGAVAGRQAGLMLLNDSTYGHAIDGQTLHLNILRSTYDPDPVPEPGQHELRLALAPCPADHAVTAAMWDGHIFDHPLPLIGTDHHRGTLPATGSFLSIAPAELSILAIKGAEDGNGAIIVRLHNPGTQPLDAVVGRVRSAQRCDVLEQPLPNSPLLQPDANGAVRCTIAAGGLCTLRVMPVAISAS